MTLPHPVEMTLSFCKISDTTGTSLDVQLLRTVLFIGHVFLKHAWRVCFAQCLLLLLPDYLHGLSGASQLLRMAAQLNHWQGDSFASFPWPSSDHSVLLTAVTWENRECMCRTMLADAFLIHTEKEQKGNGSASLGKKAMSWRHRSIWNPRLLRNNFMCYCTCHFFAKSLYMPFVSLKVAV